MISPLVACMFFCGLQTQGAPSTQVQPRPGEPSSLVALAARSPETGALTVAEFLELCEEASDFTFLLNARTTRLARTTPFGFRFPSRIRVPKDDFPDFVQAVLLPHEFLCTPVGKHQSGTLRVSRTDWPPRRRNRIRYLQPEELSDYARTPHELVITVLSFPGTNLRPLAARAEQLGDPWRQRSVIPTSKGMCLILVGFGDEIAALVRDLRDLESNGVLAEALGATRWRSPRAPGETLVAPPTPWLARWLLPRTEDRGPARDVRGRSCLLLED